MILESCIIWQGIDRFFFWLKVLRVITNQQKKPTSYYEETEVVYVLCGYFSCHLDMSRNILAYNRSILVQVTISYH